MSSFGEKVHNFHQLSREVINKKRLGILLSNTILRHYTISSSSMVVKALPNTKIPGNKFQSLSPSVWFMLTLPNIFFITFKLSLFGTANEMYAYILNSTKTSLANWDLISFLPVYIEYEHFISLNYT